MQEHPNIRRCLRVTEFGNAITPLPIAKPTLFLGVTDIEDNLMQKTFCKNLPLDFSLIHLNPPKNEHSQVKGGKGFSLLTCCSAFFNTLEITIFQFRHEVASVHGLGLNQHVKGWEGTPTPLLSPKELYSPVLPPLQWSSPSSLWSVEMQEPVSDVPRAP